MAPRKASGSRRSPNAVEPVTSQNSKVTVLRTSTTATNTCGEPQPGRTAQTPAAAQSHKVHNLAWAATNDHSRTRTIPPDHTDSVADPGTKPRTLQRTHANPAAEYRGCVFEHAAVHHTAPLMLALCVRVVPRQPVRSWP